MGTKDGFTSVKQLENKLKSAAGRVETHLIEGASHFQMEGAAYDAEMANLITTFISSLWECYYIGKPDRNIMILLVELPQEDAWFALGDVYHL